jgi:hypothetical protein
MLIDERRDRIGRAGTHFMHIGEWRQRFAQIIVRREQGHRLIRRLTADDAHAAALPALVDQRNSTSRMRAEQFNAGDLIAQFDRQIELRFRLRGGFRRCSLEVEACFAEREAFAVERADEALRRAFCTAAQHAHDEGTAFVLGSGERIGGLIGRHQRHFWCNMRKALREFTRMAGGDAIGDPHDIRFRPAMHEFLDRRDQRIAIGNERLRFDRAQMFERMCRIRHHDLAAALRSCCDGDRPAAMAGCGDPLRGGVDPLLPIRRCGPAVIEHEQQRPAAALPGRQRIENGSGDSEDQRRRNRQP